MYCYVEDGAVVDGPKEIPRNWENISNLSSLSDAELLPIGWFPFVETKEDLPSEYYHLADGGIVVGPVSVTRHWSAVQDDLDTVKAGKLSSILSARHRQDETGEDYEAKKVDAGEWSEAKRIALDMLTERADIEAFDAGVPTVVTAPANRVAAVMLEQAETYLTAEHFRSVVGANPRLDALTLAILHTWMKSNYDAIDGGTDAVTPPEQIRQHVRVPGENKERFFLRRHTWGEEFGLQAWVEGVDVSGLTLKVYDESGTELIELPFVADSVEGRWIAETGDGQRTGSKIAFMFSLVWGGNNMQPPILMPLTADQHNTRALRWGGV